MKYDEKPEDWRAKEDASNPPGRSRSAGHGRERHGYGPRGPFFAEFDA